MPRRILVVEDESAIADSLVHTLTREGFETRVAGDGEAGLHLAEQFDPDLVILDLLLPKLSGLDLCRLLRQRSSVPIIMLTAKAEEVDRVVGLEMGADDYVVKPFSLRELVARVRAVLRRQQMSRRAGATGYRDEHLAIDLERPRVAVADREVTLTPREFGLLKALLAHRGRVRTREQLLAEAWGSDEYIDPRTVDVHIRWLRKKLEPDPEHPRYLETVRGLGYRFSR